MPDKEFINHQLAEIERYLQQADLWSKTLPSELDLSSTIPFAADTLTLEQWLQFIYLPQMRQYLQQHQWVPEGMQVAPMAHEVFASKHLKLTHLLMTLDNLSEKKNG